MSLIKWVFSCDSTSFSSKWTRMFCSTTKNRTCDLNTVTWPCPIHSALSGQCSSLTQRCPGQHWAWLRVAPVIWLLDIVWSFLTKSILELNFYFPFTDLEPSSPLGPVNLSASSARCQAPRSLWAIMYLPVNTGTVRSKCWQYCTYAVSVSNKCTVLLRQYIRSKCWQ